MKTTTSQLVLLIKIIIIIQLINDIKSSNTQVFTRQEIPKFYMLSIPIKYDMTTCIISPNCRGGLNTILPNFIFCCRLKDIM